MYVSIRLNKGTSIGMFGITCVGGFTFDRCTSSTSLFYFNRRDLVIKKSLLGLSSFY